VSGYFFWNGLIRLLMETYLELILGSILNIRTADWDSDYPDERYSNYLSVVLLVISTVLLLLFVVFYVWNFSALNYDRFRSTYSAVLDGTNFESTNPRRIILVYPVIFFARRLIFVLSVIYLQDFLWAQLAIQTMISVFIVQYLLLFWPLESAFAVKMEVMNECTIVLMSYGQMCFTDFVPEPETRSLIGLYYIGVTVANVLVHLTFLV